MGEPPRSTGGRARGKVKVYEKAATSSIMMVLLLIGIILVGMVFLANYVLNQAGGTP